MKKTMTIRDFLAVLPALTASADDGVHDDWYEIDGRDAAGSRRFPGIPLDFHSATSQLGDMTTMRQHIQRQFCFIAGY